MQTEAAAAVPDDIGQLREFCGALMDVYETEADVVINELERLRKLISLPPEASKMESSCKALQPGDFTRPVFQAWPALHLCARFNWVSSLKRLASVGYPLDQRCDEGATALFISACHGEPLAFSVLLRLGADPNIATHTGVTPLFAAVRRGSADMVKELLAAGADPLAASCWGASPLLLAMLYGHDALVKLFVKQLTATGALSRTVGAPAARLTLLHALVQGPLHARWFAYVKTICKALEKLRKSKKPTETPLPDVLAVDAQGHSALICAIRCGNADAAAALLRAGAHAEENVRGVTAATFAQVLKVKVSGLGRVSDDEITRQRRAYDAGEVAVERSLMESMRGTVDLQLELAQAFRSGGGQSLSDQLVPTYSNPAAHANPSRAPLNAPNNNHSDPPSETLDHASSASSTSAQASVSPSAHPDIDRFLTSWGIKCGGRVKHWTRRFFVLDRKCGSVAYFASSRSAEKPLGIIALDTRTQVARGIPPELARAKAGRQCVLVLCVPSRTYLIQLPGRAVLQRWAKEVEKVAVGRVPVATPVHGWYEKPTPTSNSNSNGNSSGSASGSTTGGSPSSIDAFFTDLQKMFEPTQRKPSPSLSQTPSVSPQSTKSSAQSNTSEDLRGVKQLRLEDLVFERIIGSGQFGRVYAGRWRSTLVAIKELNAEHLDEHVKKEFLNECKIMAHVGNHPNVVHFIGALATADKCYMVTEFAEKGSLFDVLFKQSRVLSPIEKLKFARDAAAGLVHLHAEGVVHRDIASRNFLVDGTDRVLVADFGFSRVLATEAQAREGAKTDQTIGPVRWMAPECMSEQRYSAASDAFGFGCFLVELVDRRLPYEQMSLAAVVTHVMRDGGHPVILSECHDAFLEVGKNVWKKEPRERWNMRQVLDRFEAALKEETDKSENNGISTIRIASLAISGTYTTLNSGKNSGRKVSMSNEYEATTAESDKGGASVVALDAQASAYSSVARRDTNYQDSAVPVSLIASRTGAQEAMNAAEYDRPPSMEEKGEKEEDRSSDSESETAFPAKERFHLG